MRELGEKTKYFLYLLTASLLDATSTTIALLETTATEMNPYVAYLFNNFTTTQAFTLTFTTPIIISLIFYLLWATPSMKSLGKYGLLAMITSQTIASINNNLITLTKQNYGLAFIAILSALYLIMKGLEKDRERNERKKLLETLDTKIKLD